MPIESPSEKALSREAEITCHRCTAKYTRRAGQSISAARFGNGIVLQFKCPECGEKNGRTVDAFDDDYNRRRRQRYGG